MGKNKIKNNSDSEEESSNVEILKNIKKDFKIKNDNSQNYIYYDNINTEENENNLASIFY